MTFEEQLTKAFETLTDRLRGEIDQQVRRASAELVAAAPYDRHPAVLEAARQELELAVENARREAHDQGLAAGREAADAQARAELTQAVAAAKQEAHEHGLAAGREAAEAQAREALAHAVTAAREEAHERGLAAGRESADAQARVVLAREVEAARHEAHEQGLVAGRQEGHARAVEELTPPPQVVKAVFDVHLVDAMRSMGRARSLTEILDALVSAARADVSQANVWLMRGRMLHQWRGAVPGQDGAADPVKSVDEDSPIAEAARNNTIASADGVVAVPIAISGVVVAVLLAELGDSGSANDERRTPNDERRTPNDERRTTNVELLTAYASRSLEALTAFKTARALTQHPERRAADASPQAPDSEAAEENTSARRYARLLVSEIKLYHEAAVVDGRRDRDLASRLGGEIARARVMYEQRVPSPVRAQTDYFHEELVRTLADGDATLLEVRSEKLEVRSES